MAYAGWKGKGFDFTPWSGRNFWGIDNSNLATNETIFSVITRYSNLVATLPLKLHDANRNVLRNDVASLVIYESNRNMSAFEFMRNIEVSRNETGNGYAFILRDVKYYQPIELIPIDANYVETFLNTDDGLIYHKVQVTKGSYIVPDSDMIHVKHISGPSRLKGINPLKVLSNTIKYDKAVQEFSLSEMSKKDSFILTYDANIDKDKRDEVINDFRNYYNNNGGVLFQEPGVSIEQKTRQYFSADTINSEKITRSRVANVYNMPLYLLNEQGGTTASSNEQAMKSFVDMSLMPILKQYECEFNRKLLTQMDKKEGLYFKFNVNGLLRGDTSARTALYQMFRRNSIASANEIRAWEDLPPDGSPEADKLYTSGDLYPIDLPIEQRKTSKNTSEGGEE